MSINTLKKKTKHYPQVAPISGQGKLGFALNGTRRISGVVGNTNLGKHYTRTPFNGIEPKGSGGCCGKYVRNISIGNPFVNINCFNDNSIIKNSVKNNKGMIESKYKGTLHGAYRDPKYDEEGNIISKPFINWVQPMDTGYLELSSQSLYIKNLHASNICVSNAEPYEGNTSNIKSCLRGCSGSSNNNESPSLFEQSNYYNCKSGMPCSYHISGKKGIIGPGISMTGQGHLCKTLIGKGAINSSDYLAGQLLKNKCIPLSSSNAHFPMNVLGDADCVNYYITPCEAVKGGMLSKNWMNFTCS